MRRYVACSLAFEFDGSNAVFRLLNVVLLKSFLVLFLICASGAYAFARENTAVKATQTDKYIRLFFYCKQPVKFNASLKANKLQISFGRDVEINPSSIESVGAEISNVSFSHESNTATITLASNSYGMRKFIGEDFVGIDIIKPEKTASIEAEQKTSEIEPEPKTVVQEESFDRKVAGLNDIEPSAGSQEPAGDIEKPYTVAQVEKIIEKTERAKETASDAVEPTITKPSVQLAQEERPKFIPVPKLRQAKLDSVMIKTAAVSTGTPDADLKINEKPAPSNVQPAAQPKAREVAVLEEQKPVVEAPVLPAAAQVVPEVAVKSQVNETEKPQVDGNNKTDVQATQTQGSIAKTDGEVITEKPVALPTKPEQKTDGLAEQVVDNVEAPEAISIPIAERVNGKLLSKMVFEWNEPVAASVFNRAGYLWLVFDKSKDINIASLINKNSEYFLSGTQMPNRFYTILRLRLKKDINTVSYKENNNWVVGFVTEKIKPAQFSRIEMKFSDLTGSKVLLDSDTALKPLHLIDPEVGDEIVILPYLEESTGVKEKYKYVDFAFLETSQGAVIQIISDKVEVAVVDTGVTVIGYANIIDNATQSALKALKEKEDAERLGAEKQQQGAELSVLKFISWKLGGDTTFKKDLKELEWKIAEVDWSEKSESRLDLASFYLAHGMATESLGIIKVLREDDEKFSKENDVKIIEATSLYMMGRYREAEDIYDTINTSEMTESNKNEILFWRTAADINISNEIKLDKFMATNPLDKKNNDEEEGVGNSAENTKMVHETSMKLLKMIRKMDPEFVNADELQKLESTARFVTGHYQDAIKRFEETDLFTSGDKFQVEDNKLWWSTQNNKHAESAALVLLPNLDGFLKKYPDHIFNDFVLLALEDALKRSDLSKAEELQAAFREEDRAVQKNSIEFFKGLYFAKNDEVDKAVEVWQKLSKDIEDPFNRTRSEFALTVLQLDKKQIDLKQAIANLNSVRAIWRGGQLEFHILSLLGEFYMGDQQPMEGFRVWREAISAFSGSGESLLIAKKMSENFIKIYSQGGADKMPKFDAISLYYEFRELTPIGKLGDEMISKLVDRLIDVDLLDRAAALLTHQVRFRLVGEERDLAATKLIKIHLINKDPQKSIDVLDATENENINDTIKSNRKYLRSHALLELGKNNKVLTLLHDDFSKNAAFLRADVYWRNNVWRKVVDELEVPFREIRRDERKLTLDETNQLIKLAVSYALIDRQKRLEVLYEDFAELIDDQGKKNLLTFIATNKGPVDYKNLEQTVEHKDMENFLSNYMKPPIESGKS